MQTMANPELAILDDASLVSRASAGSTEALEALLERHAAAAFCAAHAVLGNRDDALDAAQSALARVALELKRGSQPKPFKGYVLIAAHSAAVNVARQNASRRKREEHVASGNARTEAAMHSDRLEQSEAIAALREELSELPADTAAMLVMHHADELTIPEVAEAAGISAEACKKRISRARDQMRERLERRGVALSGVAALADLEQDLFSASIRETAQLRSTEIAALARNAVAQAARLSLHPDTPSVAERVDAHTPNAGARASSTRGEKIMRSLCAAAVVITALMPLALFAKKPGALDAGAGTGVVGPSRPQAHRPGANANGHDRETKGEPAPVAAADGKNTDGAGASRWQAPRFYHELGMPFSMAGNGQHGALLLGRLSSQEFLKGVTLMDTADGGQNWKVSARFDPFATGGAAVDEHGNVALALLSDRADPNSVMQTLGADGKVKATEARECAEIFWLYRKAGGEFSAPRKIFSAGEKERLGEHPRVVCAGNAAWVFSYVNAGYGATDSKIVVARGEGDACPELLKQEFKGCGLETPSAWAADAKRAGFVLAEPGSRKLFHIHTTDRGATWQRIDIPFAPEKVMSDLKISQVTPHGLTRDGDKLVLLVSAHCVAGDSKKELPLILGGTLSQQMYTLVSKDLGKTWSDPRPFGELTNNNNIDAIFCLHAIGNKIAIANTSINMGDGIMKLFTDAMADTMNEAMKKHMGDAGTTGTLDPKDVEKVTAQLEAAFKEAAEKAKSTSKPDKVVVDAAAVKKLNDSFKIWVKVRISEDDGASWFDHHTFDGMQRSAMFVTLGGDSSRMHIAFTAVNDQLAAVEAPEKLDANVVIRSLAPGEWKETTTRPAWFNEEKLPEPTKEEF
ncbi:MAG TPA: sigma-70 family RNA polymerase sigma factor [Planctomycetota bacterium]|nr:sigma-70 family RNA polymerase sigma factor [Planctomycetota bacterium]